MWGAPNAAGRARNNAEEKRAAVATKKKAAAEKKKAVAAKVDCGHTSSLLSLSVLVLFVPGVLRALWKKTTSITPGVNINS